LTEYSIPALYNDKNKLAEFREKYLIQAEKGAERAINIFLKKFKKFEVVNIAVIGDFETWLKKLKEFKLNVFENKRDYEDMRIAAQFFSVNEKISSLGFATCDREFHRSLELVKKQFNIKTGNLVLLKKSRK
jgi:hypothetical protein